MEIYQGMMADGMCPLLVGPGGYFNVYGWLCHWPSHFRVRIGTIFLRLASGTLISSYRPLSERYGRVRPLFAGKNALLAICKLRF